YSASKSTSVIIKVARRSAAGVDLCGRTAALLGRAFSRDGVAGYSRMYPAGIAALKKKAELNGFEKGSPWRPFAEGRQGLIDVGGSGTHLSPDISAGPSNKE